MHFVVVQRKLDLPKINGQPNQDEIDTINKTYENLDDVLTNNEERINFIKFNNNKEINSKLSNVKTIKNYDIDDIDFSNNVQSILTNTDVHFVKFHEIDKFTKLMYTTLFPAKKYFNYNELLTIVDCPNFINILIVLNQDILLCL